MSIWFTTGDYVAGATSVREQSKQALEEILADLLAIRADDPFRELNPLAWRSAAKAG